MNARALLAAALLLVAPSGAAPAQDRLSQAAIEAMPLAEIVTAVRGRCADIVTALTELHRRHPDSNGIPDCGGAPAAAGGGPYRAMDDEALADAVAALSSDLEALVARGEALKAGTAAVPAPAAMPKPPVPRQPTPARAARPAPGDARKKQCEALQYADVKLCSDSACRMGTYRRWQQCLETGRYW